MGPMGRTGRISRISRICRIGRIGRIIRIWKLGLRDERQLDDKGRALISPGALGAHAAAVHLGQMTDDRQSESQTALPPCAGTVPLAETIEDEGEKIRGDADARIADLNDDALARAFESHLDATLFGSEFDRV